MALDDLEIGLSPHAQDVIAQRKYSDKYNADRVFVVNMPESLASAQAPQAAEPLKPEIIYVDKPIIVEHHTTEVKSDVIYVDKPVLVQHKDVQVVEVEKQIVVTQKEVQVVEVEKVVYVDRQAPAAAEASWIKYAVLAHLLLQLGLLLGKLV